MFHKVIRHFHPRYQPWATRQSYVHELVNALTFPAALAMVEGGVLGVLAKKAFDVSDMLFATIMAAPLFANLTSFFWARLARSRAAGGGTGTALITAAPGHALSAKPLPGRAEQVQK